MSLNELQAIVDTSGKNTPTLKKLKIMLGLMYDSYWKPLIKQLSMNHRPHDTRHTCISLLTAAGVDERILKKIVGHKGQGFTETVYTHVELPIKLEAINKI